MKKEIVFQDGFHGKLKLDNAEISIGREEGLAKPYDLLYGALAACLYATFLDILEKKRMTIESCVIEVDGKKRTEVPMTLETVHLTVTMKGIQKQEAAIKSFELATKYCSIYHTISQVAKMSYTIEWK